MAVGDVYQLTLQQLYAGQKIQNTVALARKTAPDPIQADCFDLATNWVDLIKTHQVDDLAHTGWRVQQVHGGTVSYGTDCARDGGLIFEGGYTPPSVGTHAGADGMPPQSAIVTTLRTGFAGRRRRGRFYLAGWSELQQAQGTVIPLFQSEVLTTWNALMAQFGPSGSDAQWQLGVWSMRIATGCEPAATHPHALVNVDVPNPADAFRPVTETIVRNIVYGQRRRTIGIGA